jgi:hypothetical protein
VGHYAVSQADARTEQGHFIERRNDGLGGLQPAPAVSTLANMLAEGLEPESAFLVDEQVDFVW